MDLAAYKHNFYSRTPRGHIFEQYRLLTSRDIATNKQLACMEGYDSINIWKLWSLSEANCNVFDVLLMDMTIHGIPNSIVSSYTNN